MNTQLQGPALDHIALPLRALALPIDTLILDPSNARTHDEKNLAAIKSSLSRFGQRLPLVVQKQGLIVRAGNGRVMAATELGWTHIACVVVDESEVEATAYAIADNRSGELAQWDDAALAKLLESLPEDAFAATGFDQDDLSDLLDSLAPVGVTEDDAPDPPEDPVTRPGDLWLLGEHRVLCADSTRPESVQRLFGTERTAMCFTDPPWNVAIGTDSNPRHRQRPGLRNDDLSPERFEAFLSGFIAALLPVLDGDLYCVLGASEWPTLDRCLREAGFHWSATVIWVKDAFVLGRSKYHRRYEPLWYGWREQGASSYCAGRDQDDVREIPRPRRSEEHPTMKPVALPARAIAHSSRRGQVVYDAFLGAGSSLLAAEQLERRCYGIELEPAFVDVCVMRWQDHTGQAATLDGDGRSFAEISVERLNTQEKDPEGLGVEGEQA